MISSANIMANLKLRLNDISIGTRLSINNFCGYSVDEILSRLMQRYAEHSIYEFSKFSADKYKKTGHLPDQTEVINCGGLLVCGNKEVRVTSLKFISQLLIFFAHWVYTLSIILASINFTGSKKNITMIYGIGLQDLLADGDDVRFLSFCRETPVKPIADASLLVIKALKPIKSTDSERVRYGRFPLLLTTRWCGLGLKFWVIALKEHLLALWSFMGAIYSLPPLVFLGQDIAYHAVVTALNRQKSIKDVIFTTSNYFSQPLWFWALKQKCFSSHLVWYSQNSYPITYHGELVPVVIPNFHYIRVDIQWVWSNSFADFLRENCPKSEINVVGPILWHLPSRKILSIPQSLKLVIFDVTPISSEGERKFGLLRNFYSEEMMTKFIRDIVDASQEAGAEICRKIEVVLKHKRPHTQIHSSNYIDSISNLVISREISLVESSSNLYDLIMDGFMVIAAPFSSPVYVGQTVGTHSIWYDPSGSINPKFSPQDCCLIQTKKDLKCSIQNAALNYS